MLLKCVTMRLKGLFIIEQDKTLTPGDGTPRV